MFDYNSVARDAIRDIGYTNDDDVFHADKIFVMNIITQQSPRHRPRRRCQGGGRQKERRARARATRASCSVMPATRRRN